MGQAFNVVLALVVATSLVGRVSYSTLAAENEALATGPATEKRFPALTEVANQLSLSDRRTARRQAQHNARRTGKTHNRSRIDRRDSVSDFVEENIREMNHLK